MLREALETPGARAALVTPDRDLAGRVAAALLRFGIVADDSAGEPLADTPPAVFLRLLVRAVAEELAPVPLLALLKHPLAAAGLQSDRLPARRRARWRRCACVARGRARDSAACAAWWTGRPARLADRGVPVAAGSLPGAGAADRTRRWRSRRPMPWPR